MTAETFFKELRKIILSQPKLPCHVSSSENCSFCNDVFFSKDMYYCFDTVKSSGCLYLYDSVLCADCADCDYAIESQLCYESVDPYKSYNCDFLENCASLRDCSYCYACTNCHNIFGCVNLKNKSFCIFNRQLTEGEYKEKVKKFKALPAEKVLTMLDELKQHYPWTQTNEGNNENTNYGNYIYRNKNCYLCFDAFGNENSAYLYDSHRSRTSFDFTYSVDCELSYECVDSVPLFNCNFIVYSGRCQDSSYLFNCEDCKNCLGCVKLSHKEHCILNRQFTKEDYERISTEIFQDLKQKNPGWADLEY